MMERRFCTACGAPFEDEAQKFCTNCGAALPAECVSTAEQEKQERQAAEIAAYDEKQKQKKKKRTAIFVTLGVIALLAVAIWAAVNWNAPNGIMLSKTEVTMTTSDQVKIFYALLPLEAKDKGVTWTSDDESVATVEDGVVTAVGKGKCRVTATTWNGKSATCTVRVRYEGHSFEIFDDWVSQTVLEYDKSNEKYVEAETQPILLLKIIFSVSSYYDSTGELIAEDGTRETFKWQFVEEDAGASLYTTDKNGMYMVYFEDADELGFYTQTDEIDNCIIFERR